RRGRIGAAGDRVEERAAARQSAGAGETEGEECDEPENREAAFEPVDPFGAVLVVLACHVPTSGFLAQCGQLLLDEHQRTACWSALRGLRPSPAAHLGASRARACGTTDGYSYAGLAAPSRAFGIGATVTPVGPFNILAGHVAGWVGVGGTGEGPNGTDEWLQVGFSGFPSLAGSDLYYELTLPSGRPTYHQIAADLPVGKTTRFAVLEMRNRPSWWRVWVNGSPASQPIYMPGSHDRWAPIATAESWDGGTSGQCNGFLYRFDTVS